jgi:hypothetical protein
MALSLQDLQIHPELMTVPIASLVRDQQQVQQRVSLDTEKVVEYKALYQDGHDLGCLIVFQTPSGVYYLADGFHRTHAAALAGLTELHCEVYQGTKRDAILYATSCNLHGKPLTNADKRKRVHTLLHDPEWNSWSDNSIAKHCGVTQPFVSKLRAEVSLITEISDDEKQSQTTRTYRNRYGTIQTMATGKIGHQNSAPVPSPETPAPEATVDTINSYATTTLDEVLAPPILTEILDPAPPPDAPAWSQQVYTGDNEWYTPDAILALVRAVLGTIDVDPASCDVAQARVQARTYYTLADDGLRQEWHGKIFLNPPYTSGEIPRLFTNCWTNWTPSARPRPSCSSTLPPPPRGSSRPSRARVRSASPMAGFSLSMRRKMARTPSYRRRSCTSGRTPRASVRCLRQWG